MKNIIDSIVQVLVRQASFWSHAHGWAPRETAELLEICRLDRQVSLAHNLRRWVDQSEEEMQEGALILAWANLGALVEGNMKLFLCVYRGDYMNSRILPFDRNRNVIEPDGLFFMKMIDFYEKEIWDDAGSKKWVDYAHNVRKRRNAIHSYQDKEIGTFGDWDAACRDYLELIQQLDSQMPYP